MGRSEGGHMWAGLEKYAHQNSQRVSTCLCKDCREWIHNKKQFSVVFTIKQWNSLYSLRFSIFLTHICREISILYTHSLCVFNTRRCIWYTYMPSLCITLPGLLRTVKPLGSSGVNWVSIVPQMISPRWENSSIVWFCQQVGHICDSKISGLWDEGAPQK